MLELRYIFSQLISYFQLKLYGKECQNRPSSEGSILRVEPSDDRNWRTSEEFCRLEQNVKPEYVKICVMREIPYGNSVHM